jgi:hypothetical protein
VTDSAWLTVPLVVSYLDDEGDGVTPPSTARPALQDACNAAAAYVEGKHPGYFSDAAVPVYVPPADIKLGAIMLAARWYARRGSALGNAGFSEFGGDTILRHDPDIARLLRLGTFGAFTFGAPSVTPPVTDEVLIDGGDATP